MPYKNGKVDMGGYVGSEGVGGVGVFTTVGSLAMGKARKANNKERLARAKRKRTQKPTYVKTYGEMGTLPGGFSMGARKAQSNPIGEIIL